MKIWIARDEDNGLFLYAGKPIKSSSENYFISGEYPDNYLYLEIPEDAPIGDGITFENSPQEIELVRK